MRLAHSVVGKVHAPALQQQVVQRQPRGLGRWGRFWCVLGSRQLGNHIVHVVTALAQVGEAQHGVFHGEGIHHRRQAQQRLQFGVHIHAPDGQLCLALSAFGPGHGNVAQRQFQRPGLEVE